MRQNEERLYHILKEDAMIPNKVEQKMQETYSKIEGGDIRQKRVITDTTSKYKFRAAAAVAFTVLAIGTTAYAAARHSAILDSFAKFDSGRELPEQARSLIQTEVDQEKVQDGYVNFKVREALCDKNNIVVAVEAKAAEPDKYLLVPEDLQGEEDLNNMVMENLNPAMKEKDMTIADYAKKYHKEILPVGVGVDTGAGVSSIDFKLEEDGTGIFTCSSENVSKKMAMELSCSTSIFYKDDIIRDSFGFTVNDNSKAVETVVYRTKGQAEVEGTKLVIDEIKFEKSATDMKGTITYHYAGNPSDITEEDEDTGFFLFDQNGKQLKDGVGMPGSSSHEKGKFTQADSYALTELPEQLTLQAKNVMTKEVYGKINVYRVK